jgi:phosphatidylinositol alpha-1,6-mannosyltransferase
MSKALLVSEVFPPQTGGSGRWLYELYRRLPAGSVAVAAGEFPGADEFDREQLLPIERMPLAFSTWGCLSRSGVACYWQAIKRLREMIRRHQPTALHCGKILPEGWLAWLIKLRLGLPYVVFVHGEEMSVAAGSRELAWMTRRVLVGAERIVVNSRNTEQLLTAEWQVAPAKIVVLHPGVDATRFCPAPRDAAVRARLGWGERPVVLTVGRLQKRKGHDMLLRALPAIRERVPDVLYAIVGEGPERAALERLIGELGLGENVQLRGEPSDAELIECYQQCDLFVLPNRTVDGDFEGFGMVLVEAQACGKPVIAGASGGTAETMSVGKTGELVSCDGPELLAQAIAQHWHDPEQLARRGRAARIWAVDNFDWDALVQKAEREFGMGQVLPSVKADAQAAEAAVA